MTNVHWPWPWETQYKGGPIFTGCYFVLIVLRSVDNLSVGRLLRILRARWRPSKSYYRLTKHRISEYTAVAFAAMCQLTFPVSYFCSFFSFNPFFCSLARNQSFMFPFTVGRSIRNTCNTQKRLKIASYLFLTKESLLVRHWCVRVLGTGAELPPCRALTEWSSGRLRRIYASPTWSCWRRTPFPLTVEKVFKSYFQKHEYSYTRGENAL